MIESFAYINPHRRKKHEDLGDESKRSTLLVLRPRCSNTKTCKFPYRTNQKYPTETEFLVCESLINVEECRDAKDDGEDYRGSEGGIVVVVCIAGPFRDVAVLIWCDTDA